MVLCIPVPIRARNHKPVDRRTKLILVDHNYCVSFGSPRNEDRKVANSWVGEYYNKFDQTVKVRYRGQ